jgi:integrase
MTNTVKHAKLESRAARARLKRGRQAHWQSLVLGKEHLGYQRWPNEPDGRWIWRHRLGSARKDGKHFFSRYQTITLGRADDTSSADGERILSYAQAMAAARAAIDTPRGRVHGLTVRQALDRYVEFKHSQGQGVNDLLSRSRAHILPTLGDLPVSELTPELLRRWLAKLAAMPAQTRPRAGRPQYQDDPTTEEDVRRRRASANRVLTMLKAALNHAYDEGHVANRDAWGRRLAPFKKVEVARVRYLTVAEAQRLINAADEGFRPLLRAGLESGCRYGELSRLEVCDFDPAASTLAIRQSKSGKPRHVVLTDEGAAFFQQHCLGRSGHELMFQHEDGSPWRASEQGRPMAEACTNGKIRPAISFHILRHTWASHAVMNGVPLLVVAKNLGHATTVMTEKHYGHLAENFVSEAIRERAPRYGLGLADKRRRVVPLR